MAVIQGKMFLLVHVDKHRDQMGDICNRLVSDYGVPVSICDDIQKVCPKCLASPDAIKSDSSPVSTTTVTQSFDHHRHEETKNIPKILPPNVTKLFSPPAPKQISVSSAPQKSQPIQLKTVMSPTMKSTPILSKPLLAPSKNMPITLRVGPSLTAPRIPPVPQKPSNGNHLSTPITSQLMVVKRRESPVPQIVPEVKKIKIEEPSIKEEEILLDDLEEDDDGIMLGNVLKALQNGNHDLPFNGSPSSDDGASNSSNTYELDDDDYQGTWNPDFLTNFITSQPAIFSATTQESSRTQSKIPSVGGNGKRLVPPMLTVNGKTRRGRIVYTSHELDILEKYYEEDPNACADPRKRDEMCKKLSIDYHRLKVWFQNRRRKDKVKLQEDPSTITNGIDSGLEA
uniref:Homeobox domain-containing protein n=1 Tax=Caenorhabditis tropicalis TaxID=1561998 RepID=A0A1I7UCC1_9PELO